MEKTYGYWDSRYKVGKINFIKESEDNPQRKFFVDWVSKADHIKSILEVGPGEMLEYQRIRKLRPDIKYSIADISVIFIENCKLKYRKVNTYRVPLEKLNNIKNEFDCVYLCSVLEHSVNVSEAIKNTINLGKEFHFVFFKWRWTGGGLESRYYPTKNLCSTNFNIWEIINEIKKYAEIDYCNIISRKGNIHSIEEYQSLIKKKKGNHRNGGWLAIHGRRK